MDFQSSARQSMIGWSVAALGAAVLIYYLSPILTPFLFGAILAYICDPLVTRLQRLRVPRTLGVILVMTMLVGLFVLMLIILVPMFEQQVSTLIQRTPDYVEWMGATLVPWVRRVFGIDLPLDAAHLREALRNQIGSAGGIVVQVLPTLKTGGMAVIGFLTNLVLVPLVMFYLLRDWDRVLAGVKGLIPGTWRGEAVAMGVEIDRVLGQFLRGQLSVMAIMSLFYVAGLWLTGLEYALPIGIVAGLLVFVPYLGAIVGVTLATLTGMIQFGSFAGLIPIWIVFAAGQAVEGFGVTPWLVGDRIGLHPVAVIFALLAFGQLFGFFGVLLALPASAALLVGARYMQNRWMQERPEV